MDEVKNIDSLIVYMQDKHGISFENSKQKRMLKNIGYYHGYKGYRYINSPENKITYTNFDEIIAINSFDMKLKAIIYPQIMFIETALKNYVLEVILSEAKSANFHTIYNKLLLEYKEYHIDNKQYSYRLKTRLYVRNTIYNTLSKGYNSQKKIVQHFYEKDETVPIWGIFEIISLGDFGSFVSCLNKDCRKQISENLGLHQPSDTKGKLVEKIIFTLKDLRNSVAHNDVIFDTRFKRSKIDNSLKACLKAETLINDISFGKIEDYFVLIVYVLNCLKVSKNDILKFITEFEDGIETLRKQIPISIYNQIINTETKNKIKSLRMFLNKI